MSTNTTIDDTSPFIVYSPASAWAADNSFGQYRIYNGTVTGTTQADATATLRFKGTSVAVLTLFWPTGGNYTVTLDGTSLGQWNTAVASTDAAVSKAAFGKDNLDGNVEHTLVITKAANDPHWVSPTEGDGSSHLNLDGIIFVGQAISPTGSSSNSSSNSSPTPSSSSLPTGAIAGIVVGVVILLLLGVAGFVFHRRRKATKLRKQVVPIIDTSFTESKTPATLANNSSAALSSTLPPISTTALAPAVGTQTRGEKTGVTYFSPTDNPRGPWSLEIAQDRAPAVATAPRVQSSGAGTAISGSETHMTEARDPVTPSIFSNTHSIDSVPALPASTSQPRPQPPGSTSGSRSPPSGSASGGADGSSSSPAEEGRRRRDEKAIFQGNQHSSSSTLPGTASSIPGGSLVSPTSTTTGDGRTGALERELAVLREQVRHLTEVNHQRDDGLDTRTAYTEPPPEYVGRDSDEETRSGL